MFYQAYNMEELANEEQLETEECKDIADCELSRVNAFENHLSS